MAKPTINPSRFHEGNPSRVVSPRSGNFDMDVTPCASERLGEQALWWEGNDFLFGDPLGQPEYGRGRFHREHGEPRGVHCALRAELDEAITRAVCTAAGSGKKFPSVLGAELPQPAATLEFVGQPSDVCLGVTMARMAYNSR